MNNITISGRITKDIKLESSKGGKNYIMNWLAVQRDKDNADFIKFVAWEHQAEYLSRYAKKGDKAVINGCMRVSQYETNGQKREDYSVLVRDIVLMPSKKDEKQNEIVEHQNDNTPDVNFSDLPF